MRILALSAAVAIFFCSGANAAYLYGSSGPVPYWAGFYLGVNGGYVGADRTANFTPNDANVSAITCGGFFGGTCAGPADISSSGGLAGVQAGYNWEAGSWLLGFETDIDWSNLHGTGTSTFNLGAASADLNATEDLNWFGTARARVGVKLGENVLTYATAGLAYGGVHSSLALDAKPGANASAGFGFSCAAGPACFAGSSSRTAAGWTAGVGVEYSFWGNISVRAEYLYMDLGSGAEVRTAALNGAGAAPSSFTAALNENEFNVFRLGLNYRFSQCCEPLK